MALKQKFDTGTKYYYACISRLDLARNAYHTESVDAHQMQVILVIKDTEDDDMFDVENEFIYSIPSVKIIKNKTYATVPVITAEGTESLDENGDVIYEEVEQGDAEIVDPDYVDPFKINTMDIEGNNIVKLGYDWLKSNIQLFSGWEDC